MHIGNDKIVRQIIGIPMGTNPAVFIANFYCFTYELEFIESLIERKMFGALDCFEYTLRYIDDLLSINNPFFEIFATTSNDKVVMADIKGIYPKSLTVNLEQKSFDKVSFLDTELYFKKYTLYTRIYDKREHPPLNRVPKILYPNISSFLGETAIYGCILGELVRYERLSSTKAEFIKRARKFLKVLHEKNKYDKNIIKKYVKRFLNKYKYIFNINSTSFLKVLTNFLD